MKRLILIRHGQSEHHIQGLTGGWTDTSLTLLGRAQAQAAAERCKQLISEEPSLCLYSSNLLRAAQTAEYIANALGLECQRDPALREINNGIAVNMTWEEAKQLELPETQPLWHWLPYPEAESWFMMTERVFAGMERIERVCASTAVIVAHGFSGVAIIQWWLRLDEHHRQNITFQLSAASITELSLSSRQERTIVRLNDSMTPRIYNKSHPHKSHCVEHVYNAARHARDQPPSSAAWPMSCGSPSPAPSLTGGAFML